MAEVRAAKSVPSNGNGLLLYYSPQSYYSQRVLMVLNEKKLKFQTQLVKLMPEMEVHQPWFIRMNPEGAIPVLKDGVKIIPDSSRIIDYLEDNFSNGATPRLMPEKGSEEAAKVKLFRDEIESLSAKILTYGSLNFPEVTKDMILDKRKKDLFSVIKVEHIKTLKQYKDENPDLNEIYEKKMIEWNKFMSVIDNKDKLLDVLDNLKLLMKKVEAQLASHSKESSDWWLCSKQFTIADIYLAVLLFRLKFIGLSYQFFESPENYPNLALYFKKIQTRQSVYSVVSKYPSLIPQSFAFSSFLGISVLVAGLACVFFFKRQK